MSETQAIEGIRKEFSDSITNLVPHNKALREELTKVKEDLQWAIDEINELEKEAMEEETEG